MSFFISGFKTDSSVIKDFEKILVEIVPDHQRDYALRVENRSSNFVSYGDGKVIRDVIIHDENQGSWLALVGTPLVHFESNQKKLSFLSEYLKNPSDSLRNTIDGNFAVFSYDALKDRFMAATDFNSTIPIFYAATPKGILFSSYELALARYTNAEIDPFGFSQSIHLGVTWSTHSRFKNIQKLLPCQLSLIDANGGIKTERYWQTQEENIWTGSFDDQIERWNSLITDSVRNFSECSGQKKAVCDFTGGEDSRLMLAHCHSLGIPFKAQVTGLENDIDVIVAKRASDQVGFDLIERRKSNITKEQLLANAFDICVSSDAYQEFFKSCTEFATNLANPLDDYRMVKYCGIPGGEAFRGSYYLRGKAIFPSMRISLDYKFFTKMKYLLDFHPSLLKFSDDEFLRGIYEIVEGNLDEVKGFSVGTQIDHLLRVFQTCSLGLKYKNPLYLPFATSQMTRSIYGLSPRFKKGGRLTKACTEILFPELAVIKNQYGVPTIRKTMLRLPLFMPEYISHIKNYSSGAVSRLFKWTQANKWYYSLDWNSQIFNTLLNNPPYCDWFSSSKSMITGHMYNEDLINTILVQAKTGSCKYIPILGRIISQELAARWVYRKGLF